MEEEKKTGFFGRLAASLSKTRQSIVSGIDSIFGSFDKIDSDFYEELEETLILGDIGVRATNDIMEDLREKVREQHITDPNECRQVLIDSIKSRMDLGENAYDFENQKSVLLLIGVNGVGKTTSIAKLAASFKNQGKKVLVAGADTFRAGAIDQLRTWCDRFQIDMISSNEGADPASVVYDACAAAKARGVDILLIDTAGRLHNKKNLMEELRKIYRVIGTEYPESYRETLLVLDGTTGQNALEQAREFKNTADITGIILTKLDGTAKGGIAVAVQAELSIPVKYIGIGEHVEDLNKFNSQDFVDALFETRHEV